MKKLYLSLGFVLFSLALYAQPMLNFEFRLLLQNSYNVQLKIAMTNTGDEAWTHEFSDSEVFFYSVDGTMHHGMVLPIVLPLTLAPGATYSETLCHESYLENGVHLFQAYLAIQNADSTFFAVGAPLSVNIVNGATICIGDSFVPNRIPIDFWWRTTMYECLISAAEMHNIAGYLEGITLYYDFQNESFWDQNISIALGLVNSNDLSAGWVEANSFSNVHNYMLDFPTTESEIYIPIHERVLLDGIRNLAIRFFRPFSASYQVSSDPFSTFVSATARGRKITSDVYNWQILSPPTANVNQLTNILPRLTLHTQNGPVEIGEPIEPAGNEQISIFPNPSRDFCIVKNPNNYEIAVYNVKGQIVAKLKPQHDGSNEILWNFKDFQGKNCASGVYFFMADTKDKIAMGKVLYIK